MIECDEPGNRTDGEKREGKGESYAADEILIVDYVMLDFVDEPFAPWENDRQGHESAVPPGLVGDPGEDPRV